MCESKNENEQEREKNAKYPSFLERETWRRRTRGPPRLSFRLPPKWERKQLAHWKEEIVIHPIWKRIYRALRNRVCFLLSILLDLMIGWAIIMKRGKPLQRTSTTCRGKYFILFFVFAFPMLFIIHSLFFVCLFSLYFIIYFYYFILSYFVFRLFLFC